MSKKEHSSLENKTTTELLDSIPSLTDETGHTLEGYDETLDELNSREPFYSLKTSDSGKTVNEEISDLWDAIKELRRHKHDDKTGDVMIRV